MDVDGAVKLMAKETILVVEDEEDIRELLKYNLEKEGYQVFGAATGEEGLRAVRDRRPDLILLDLMLPGLVLLCHKIVAKVNKLCLCWVHVKCTLTQYRGQVSCVCGKAVHCVGSCRPGGTFSSLLHGPIVAC